MPKTRRVLDSSPVAIPSPKKIPLQRSASTASLPTPPQTHHRRKHSSDTDSDTDGGIPCDTDDLPVAVPADYAVLSRNKKRRRVKGKNRDNDEDKATFWGRNPTVTPKAKPLVQEKRREPSPPSASTSPVPVLFRSGQSPKAPVSPPPSRRRPVTRSVKATSSQVEPPSSGPVRDSPNNPFLAFSPPSLIDSEPHTPTRSSDFEEKSTITYV